MVSCSTTTRSDAKKINNAISFSITAIITLLFLFTGSSLLYAAPTSGVAGGFFYGQIPLDVSLNSALDLRYLVFEACLLAS